MSDRPTVGRVVHYRSHGSPVLPAGSQKYESKCRAAIVTDVTGFSHMAALAVLNPMGLFFDDGCDFDPSARKGGTWHWPERDDAS